MSVERSQAQAEWVCGWCGSSIGSEVALRDHQEWCLGDAQANERLIAEVAARESELPQEALVAAARQLRLAREAADPRA